MKQESVWKKVFEDHVFKINGKSYKLDDIIVPSSDKTGKTECVSAGFRLVGSRKKADIITIEIPMKAVYLFAKHLVSFKSAFGDFSAELEKIQAEGADFLKELASGVKAFFKTRKK
jgi:hypothetical protein